MASVGFAAKRVLLPLAVVFMSFVPMASAAPLDEAQMAEYPAEKFKHSAEPYFHDMDNGVSLSPEEVQGRNMWILWTGGDDKFWDGVTKNSLGTFDLLKIVTSHPSQTYCYGHCERDSRWKWYGVVNEPCFDKPTGPDPVRFGLWLDVRRKDCPAEPFEDESKYPGVKIGSRGKSLGDGKTLPVGSYYGYPSGVVGLRLFPNPDFDEAAARAWDPERFYTDKDYYTNPKLVRPYRLRHVLRLLSRGTKPDPSASGSRTSYMGGSQFNGRGPISLDGSNFGLRGR